MIKQTLDGKDVIIIHNLETGKYLVFYEGETQEVDERPVTDQDIEQL